MRNTIKYVLIVVASLIITFFINIDTSAGLTFIDRLNGNYIIYVVEAILFGMLFNKVCDENNKRLIVISCIVSAIFATFEVIGFSINHYLALIIPKVALLKWIGFFVVFAAIIIWLYNLIDSYRDVESKSKLGNLLKSKKSILVLALIIFIAWMPYFIKYYPGVLSPDSIDQVSQAIGAKDINNHHPAFHTMIISVFIGLGNQIGDINTGVAMYSVFQMIVMAFIFGFALYYMNKKNMPILVTVISFVFFAIYPVMPMYSITMWKDILFGGMMLLYTICVTELVLNREEFIHSKFCMIIFSIIILLAALLRNNGIYVIVLSFPFILLFNRTYWKKLLLIFVIPIVLYLLITGPLYKLLNIAQGSIGEALSVPIQQLTRVAKYDRESLSEEDYQLINKYIRLDEVDYDPRISDNAKSHFNADVFNENKGEFIGLWIKLFFQYPSEYIASFLCNSYGYWYPEAENWVVMTGVYDNQLGIERSGELGIGLLDDTIHNRYVPAISMIYSIGFAVWLTFLALMYFVYKKEYRFIQIYIGMFFLWLTVIASPVFCEYRYIFGLFTSLPILIGVIFANRYRA